MTHYKARPTTYKGIKMRSRAEAAFAQQLEGICTWEYEPECFADERGQYLPDFLVKYGRDPFDWVWVEIKPKAEVAWAAAKRMEIIQASHPDASLAVYIPGGYPYEQHRFVMVAQKKGGGAWHGSAVLGAAGPAAAARAQLAAQRAERVPERGAVTPFEMGNAIRARQLLARDGVLLHLNVSNEIRVERAFPGSTHLVCDSKVAELVASNDKALRFILAAESTA